MKSLAVVLCLLLLAGCASSEPPPPDYGTFAQRLGSGASCSELFAIRNLIDPTSSDIPRINLALREIGCYSSGSVRSSPQSAPAATTPAVQDCQTHIELHGGAHWAKELDRPEMWVLANYRINLWASASPNRGEKVGELRVGSRAVVLDETEDDYRVRSPLDNSVGWLGKIQVARTLHQNVKTREACTP